MVNSMAVENKVLKKYKYFILGKCSCGNCNESIKIRNQRGFLKRFQIHHNFKQTGENHYNHGRDLSGFNNPSWKGGRRKYNGYWAVWNPKHPSSNKHGYVYEHRLVMEQYYSRFLTKDEHIHHIDGNTQNNKIENLLIVSKSEHMILHKTIDMSTRICLLCGSDITWIKKTNKRPFWRRYKQGYICNKCYNKKYSRYNIS